MMTPSAHIYAKIQEFEGLSTKAYPCQANTLTIGYGHTKGVKEGDVCTRAQAENYLKSDVAEAAANVEHILNANEIEVTQGQFDALISFVFNFGAKKLIKSTLLEYLKQGKIEDAALELKAWNKVKTKNGYIESKGLSKRRKAEALIFCEGLELHNEKLKKWLYSED